MAFIQHPLTLRARLEEMVATLHQMTLKGTPLTALQFSNVHDELYHWVSDCLIWQAATNNNTNPDVHCENPYRLLEILLKAIAHLPDPTNMTECEKAVLVKRFRMIMTTVAHDVLHAPRIGEAVLGKEGMDLFVQGVKAMATLESFIERALAAGPICGKLQPDFCAHLKHMLELCNQNCLYFRLMFGGVDLVRTMCLYLNEELVHAVKNNNHIVRELNAFRITPLAPMGRAYGVLTGTSHFYAGLAYPDQTPRKDVMQLRNPLD